MSDPLLLALTRIGNQYDKILLVNLTKGTYSNIFLGKGEGDEGTLLNENQELEELWKKDFHLS